MNEKPGGTYQMLWDCPYCGTNKLLGLAHRHCPSCGAAQDPEKRYFPQEQDKVAVEDHEFVGADRECPSCGTPNAARAGFCGNCGGPMDGAGEIQKQADHVVGQDTPKVVSQAAPRVVPTPPEHAPKKRSKGCLVAGGCVGLIAVLAVAFGLVAAFWKKDATVTVASHSWERSIEVEVFKTVDEEAWCDELPSDARSVRRSQEVRSTNRVEVGQDCKTRQVDNGDGTFSEVQDCSPIYEEQKVYDDWCDYEVDRWTVARTERATGASVADSPAWPKVTLAKRGDCKGCEREGVRAETYTVHFTDDSTGKTHPCEFDQPRWEATSVGTSYTGKVGVMTKSLDCGSLAGR